MSTFRRNVVANLAGKVITAALGLVFPPIYVRLLGMESYGLIGVWSSLTWILGILDLGLSTTLNRKMACYSAETDEGLHREMRDIVRTIEVVYWAVGTAAGLVVALLAPAISHHWVNVKSLPGDVVTTSVRLMGLVFALQWPAGMYAGGLLGLQKQVAANAIQASFVAIRSVGGAILLWKVSASIHMFFVWQAVVMAGQTLFTWGALLRSLPGREARGTFRWRVLLDNWRFSAGMMLISLLSIIITQSDKIIASKLLSLEQFGYYSLAWVVGTAISNLVTPVAVAVFPRLSQLVQRHDLNELSRVYHATCQLMATFVLPATTVLALFSSEVLRAWTGDVHLVAMASGVVVLVAIGTGLNGLMNMPYSLQLAFGWTRLTVVTNIVAVVTIAPLEYELAKHHGMVGAAAGWLILNVGYVLIQVPVMHMRLLRGEQWRWYFRDGMLPLIGTALVTVPLRFLAHPPAGRLAIFAYLLAVGGAATLAAAAMAPSLRARGRALLVGVRPYLA